MTPSAPARDPATWSGSSEIRGRAIECAGAKQRHVRIELLHHAADHRQQGHRIGRGLHEQRHPLRVFLRQRTVHEHLRIFTDRRVLGIAGHAYDFDRRAGDIARTEAEQALTERVVSRPEPVGEGLVDDGDSRGLRIVARGEVAAQAGVECRVSENIVSATESIEHRRNPLPGGHCRCAFFHEAERLTRDGEGHHPDHRGAVDPRILLETSERILVERQPAFPGIGQRRQIEVRGKDLGRRRTRCP